MRETYIKEIVDCFNFEGEFIKSAPYGYGHINDTNAIYFKNKDGVTKRYILQRINHDVFKEPKELMNNIELVTAHLRDKIIKAGGDYTRETLNLISSKSGENYCKDSLGNYWRAYIFIEDAITYQAVENPVHFYNAGKAFGHFQKLLSDFNAELLVETIANFHNTPKRYEDFLKAVADDKVGRAKNVEKEIQFVLDRKNDTDAITGQIEKGNIPLRVTHNDTKFNNIMIDNKTGEGICVIDLDTVMPGSALYDYGDSLRSGANPAAEDEKDLSKVYLDLTLFEEFTKGYLHSAKEFLTPTEIEYMPFSAKLMTLECGMRFLGDYLNGDVYFKIHKDGHNLDRARVQFKLVEDMESKMDKMKEIVKKYCK